MTANRQQVMSVHEAAIQVLREAGGLTIPEKSPTAYSPKNSGRQPKDPSRHREHPAIFGYQKDWQQLAFRSRRAADLRPARTGREAVPREAILFPETIGEAEGQGLRQGLFLRGGGGEGLGAV